MQEHDPTAVEPDEQVQDSPPQDGSLQGGDTAQDSPPQEAPVPQEGSALQTPLPDQPHTPMSEEDDGRGSD